MINRKQFILKGVVFCVGFFSLGVVSLNAHELIQANYVDILQEEEVLYNYEWVKVGELREQERALLGLSDQDKRVTLKAKFSFLVNRERSIFSKSSFKNVSTLEELSDMDYQQKGRGYRLKFKPHPFKTVTGDSHLVFPTENKAYLDAFGWDPGFNELLLHQKVYNFSDYLDKSEIITRITALNAATLVQIVSYGILTKEQSESVLFRAVQHGMVQKLKGQMLHAPRVFEGL